MESQLLILWMVVTAFVPAHSIQCTDSLNVFAGGCLYATFSHAATKQEAVGCCGGSLTILAPAITQLMDYGSRINNTGPHHTTFTMTNSKLYLHNEEINTTTYSIYWMNNTQPTGNVSCIAAQHDSGRLVLSPVSCSDKLPFVCLSADDDACNSCLEEERCMPEFTKYACITNCRALPTRPTPTPTDTSLPPDDSTNTGETTTGPNTIDWVIPAAVTVALVAIVLVVVAMVMSRKRKQNPDVPKFPL